MAQTLSRRLPYAVNMHGAMTSRFVGFVARWVRDGLEPRHCLRMAAVSDLGERSCSPEEHSFLAPRDVDDRADLVPVGLGQHPNVAMTEQV